MKKFFALGSLIALSTPAFGQLADMLAKDFEAQTAQAPTFTDEELLETWGWLLSERFNLQDFQLSSSQIEAISRGIRLHASGQDAPTDLSVSVKAMQEYFATREQEIFEAKKAENKMEELQFFDSLMGLPDVMSLATGLAYQILEPGNEVKPKATDTVTVEYEGRFLDNTVFDTTTGRAPAQFKLNEVIPGWTQGLQLIGEGGRIKLYVPSKLGYGEDGRADIPPAKTLVFEVRLLKVGALPAPEQDDPFALPEAPRLGN